jgi:hypothetical protein
MAAVPGFVGAGKPQAGAAIGTFEHSGRLRTIEIAEGMRVISSAGGRHRTSRGSTGAEPKAAMAQWQSLTTLRSVQVTVKVHDLPAKVKATPKNKRMACGRGVVIVGGIASVLTRRRREGLQGHREGGMALRASFMWLTAMMPGSGWIVGPVDANVRTMPIRSI